MKMWSGRFRQPLDPDFERWQRSFSFDRRLLRYELDASRAHARALRKAGILSGEELASILVGLDQIKDKVSPGSNTLEDDSAEDVHHFVEKQLVSLIGDTGYKLHSGRSRNEQIATDLRLYVRSSIDQLRSLVIDWLEALLQRAEEAKNFAMPAYTHMQRAEPVLVAHWLLAYFEMFSRDMERLADCRKRVNLCPLGSGAVAGSTICLDRDAMSAELEFDAPTASSMDATSDRDFAVEFVQCLSLMGLHLSRWAEEMMLFSTEKFGFIHLPESYSTGSSAMPQKMNPDLLELVRAKSGRIFGAGTALVIEMKGLPLAYNKDLQETQEPLFDASETALSILPMVIGWMKAMRLDHDRMQAAADSGFMNAWAAATYLVRRGVSLRRAHEHVGKAVQLCLEKGCELRHLSVEELRQFSSEFDHDFYSHLELQAVLSIHDVQGGTAPARVAEALAAARQRISALRGLAHAHA